MNTLALIGCLVWVAWRVYLKAQEDREYMDEKRRRDREA